MLSSSDRLGACKAPDQIFPHTPVHGDECMLSGSNISLSRDVNSRAQLKSILASSTFAAIRAISLQQNPAAGAMGPSVNKLALFVENFAKNIFLFLPARL